MDAAVELRHAVVANHHGVVYRSLLYERLDGLPAILIHRDAKRGETAILVHLLELDKPGNFSLARPTPSGPEIEQNNLSSVVGKLDGCAVHPRQGEVRGGFPAIHRGFRGVRCQRRRAASQYCGPKYDRGERFHCPPLRFGTSSGLSAAVLRPPCSFTILLKNMKPCRSIKNVDG